MWIQRIGITCSSGQGTTQPIEKVGRRYVDGVAAAGGLPVVLPSLDPVHASAAVAGIDGLVLTGGGDIDPIHYGAVADPETGAPDAARDAWELALVGAARDSGIPLLGICRGAQVLNVAFGGTLVQHLPARSVDGHDDVGRAGDEVHPVTVAAGSRLHRIVAADQLPANTLHHQSVDEVGTGLVVSGVADDGVIEAIEAVHAPVLGVQWHPELLLDRAAHRALFGWVVHPADR
ncbi:MAG TPA: gamma-glutamyl-gamma-aminobutyrate hydrolase family protein [Acidimicrobiales bacterium]|nr:gamma-glutamyl-gamma-aminobutyrate hydrolase family protein [Acidimicrobiales bacterium]